MEFDRYKRGAERASYSPCDLHQVRRAARDLRASSAESVLVELVEEKLRAIEDMVSPVDEGGLPAPPWIPVAWSA